MNCQCSLVVKLTIFLTCQTHKCNNLDVILTFPSSFIAEKLAFFHQDFDCMSSELTGALELHWKKLDDGVSFGAKSTGTGWVSVAFPETAGVMVGADAVIGSGDSEVGVFKLEAKASSGIVAGNDAFEITDAGFESGDGNLLTFTR